MLGRSGRDFIKRALIGIASVIERHIQFDGKIVTVVCGPLAFLLDVSCRPIL
jgi:hypothetical protein